MSESEEELYENEEEKKRLAQLPELEREKILAEKKNSKIELKERQKLLIDIEKKRKEKQARQPKIVLAEQYSDGEQKEEIIEKEDVNFVCELHHLEKIMLTREQIVKYIDFPFFDEIVKGAYVRAAIQQNVYQIYEVVGVRNSQNAYKCENKQIKKELKLRCGHQDKLVKVTIISSKPCNKVEFQKFTTQHGVITLQKIRKKISDLKKAASYTLSDLEVNEFIEKRQQERVKQGMITYLDLEKLREKLIELEIQKDNEPENEVVQVEINDLKKEIEMIEMKLSNQTELNVNTVKMQQRTIEPAIKKKRKQENPVVPQVSQVVEVEENIVNPYEQNKQNRKFRIETHKSFEFQYIPFDVSENLPPLAVELGVQIENTIQGGIKFSEWKK